MTKIYKIRQKIFFNSLHFDDKSKLMKSVLNDWNRMNISLNGKKCDNLGKFLKYIKTNFTNDLETILMLCNQCCHFYNYNKIFKILSEYNFHCATKQDSDNDSKVSTKFRLTPMIKQVVINNVYNVYKIINSNTEVHEIINVETILDLSINDPVIVKVSFLPR
tara:strand:- start:741 stop:1229 length:489 start_codon:yes stop_codon:yes gene_type:complete